MLGSILLIAFFCYGPLFLNSLYHNNEDFFRFVNPKRIEECSFDDLALFIDHEGREFELKVHNTFEILEFPTPGGKAGPMPVEGVNFEIIKRVPAENGGEYLFVSRNEKANTELSNAQYGLFIEGKILYVNKNGDSREIGTFDNAKDVFRLTVQGAQYYTDNQGGLDRYERSEFPGLVSTETYRTLSDQGRNLMSMVRAGDTLDSSLMHLNAEFPLFDYVRFDVDSINKDEDGFLSFNVTGYTKNSFNSLVLGEISERPNLLIYNGFTIPTEDREALEVARSKLSELNIDGWYQFYLDGEGVISADDYLEGVDCDG